MKKIVLYGAGNQGKGLFDYLEHIGKRDSIDSFWDKYSNEKEYKGCKILSPKPQSFDMNKYCVYVSIADGDIKNSVENEYGFRSISFDELAMMLGCDPLEFSRNYIGFYHSSHMDWYYEAAESDGWLNKFWSEDSVFYKMFCTLDLSDTIEIACGHGRHVSHYIDRAGHVTLVDINQSNIDFCKNRFEDMTTVSYYTNNGFNLSELNSSQYTSAFSYDSFVHFELLDIYSYLKDIYRVLRPHGRALIHHSNRHDNYMDDFADSIAGRNFMSKDLFAYLASKSGFKVLEQKIIDWQVPKLDCVSLIEKID